MPLRPRALVVLAVALVAACGGALERSTAPLEEGARDESPPPTAASTRAGGDATNDSDGTGPCKPVAALGSAGLDAACTPVEPAAGGIGGGAAPCRIATGVETASYSDDAGQAYGYERLAMSDGTTGAARKLGADLVLHCSDGCRTIFRARLRCFAGSGDYQLPAGDLELGGQASDRTCRLSLDVTSGAAARGFIGCGREPYAPTNVFANTEAPIGLGAFDLPLTL